MPVSLEHIIPSEQMAFTGPVPEWINSHRPQLILPHYHDNANNALRRRGVSLSDIYARLISLYDRYGWLDLWIWLPGFREQTSPIQQTWHNVEDLLSRDIQSLTGSELLRLFVAARQLLVHESTLISVDGNYQIRLQYVPRASMARIMRLRNLVVRERNAQIRVDQCIRAERELNQHSITTGEELRNIQEQLLIWRSELAQRQIIMNTIFPNYGRAFRVLN